MRRTSHVGLALTFFLSATCFAADTNADSPDAALAAWRSRQDRAAAVQCWFKLERTVETPRRVTMVQRYVVSFKGADLMKIERTGPDLYPIIEQLVDREYITAFDAQSVSRSFYGETKDISDAYPTGFVEREPSGWDYAALGPLVVHFRPFNQFYSPIDDVAYTLDARLESINGQDCRRLRPATPQRVEHHYWVDPRRGWIVVRMETHFGESVISRIDAEYAEAPDGDWIPQSWTHSNHRDAQLYESSQAMVLESDVNADLPDSAFAFEFPPNTLVTDRLEGKPVVYLVRPNNVKRIVMPEERRYRMQYERYLETESGEAVDLSEPPRLLPTANRRVGQVPPANNE